MGCRVGVEGIREWGIGRRQEVWESGAQGGGRRHPCRKHLSLSAFGRQGEGGPGCWTLGGRNQRLEGQGEKGVLVLVGERGGERGEAADEPPNCPRHPVWCRGAREQTCFSEGLTMHNTDCLLQACAGIRALGARLGHRKSPRGQRSKSRLPWALCWARVGPLQ